MRSRWIAAAVAAVCITGAAKAASAETVTLKFLGGTGSEPLSRNDDVSVYPYQFSVDGSRTDTSLMCVSFDDHITPDESWTATVTDLSSSSSPFDKEEAYLFSLISSASNSTTRADIQFADWYLSDSTGVKATTFYKDNSSEVMNYVDLAESTGLDQSNLFYEGFELYTPVAGTYNSWDGYPDGIPQSFIGDAPCPPTPPPPTPTPEPGSLALLGTGLLGMGGVLRRRMRNR